jgi:hypothetical protein
VLAILRLCRRPGTAAGRTMDEDIAEIADRFALDPAALARVADAAGNPPPGPPGDPGAGGQHMTRPSEHPAHVPVPFALAVWAIMCQAGSREDRAAFWEELDKYPRAQALAWIEEILVLNKVPRLPEELRWWNEQLRTPDN